MGMLRTEHPHFVSMLFVALWVSMHAVGTRQRQAVLCCLCLFVLSIMAVFCFVHRVASLFFSSRLSFYHVEPMLALCALTALQEVETKLFHQSSVHVGGTTKFNEQAFFLAKSLLHLQNLITFAIQRVK
jgi:hypothetical protein